MPPAHAVSGRAEATRGIKAHAPHCRVIVPMYEMQRLGGDAAERTALADHLTAQGLALEMIAGPLQGMYGPGGTGSLLFAFFAAMAETEGENIREIRHERFSERGRHRKRRLRRRALGV
ncbi:recombinase family protein [Streptomyces chartreusis]|uniref:recombinase family protein n=1 Tax=Streptomyces chartreusis TaxID=1969 RepID=UPI003D8A66AF